MTVLLITLWASLSELLDTARAGARRRVHRADRGDIPGWVMIAIMSAAVVVVLIPLVGPVVGRAFTNAVDSVSNTKSSTP